MDNQRILPALARRQKNHKQPLGKVYDILASASSINNLHASFWNLNAEDCSRVKGSVSDPPWAGVELASLSLGRPERVHQSRPARPKRWWALTWQRAQLGRFVPEQSAVTPPGLGRQRSSPPGHSRAACRLTFQNELQMWAWPQVGGRVAAVLPWRAKGPELFFPIPTCRFNASTGRRNLPPSTFTHQPGGDACARSSPRRERGPSACRLRLRSPAHTHRPPPAPPSPLAPPRSHFCCR